MCARGAHGGGVHNNSPVRIAEVGALVEEDMAPAGEVRGQTNAEIEYRQRAERGGAGWCWEPLLLCSVGLCWESGGGCVGCGD